MEFSCPFRQTLAQKLNVCSPLRCWSVFGSDLCVSGVSQDFYSHRSGAVFWADCDCLGKVNSKRR